MLGSTGPKNAGRILALGTAVTLGAFGLKGCGGNSIRQPSARCYLLHNGSVRAKNDGGQV